MFTIVQWNSRDYWKGIALRNRLLKKDFGKELITSAPIAERQDIHLVVRRAGEVVGTLLLHPVNETMVQVKQVAVDASCQGLGIGRQLLQYAENIAISLGYELVFLTGRKQAWSFYEKLGYDSFEDSYLEGMIELKVFSKPLKTTKNDSIEKAEREMKTNG